jgi:hypothetical protein
VALSESEETFAAGTPEMAVQSFIKAFEGEDFQASYELLSNGLKDRCTVDQMFGWQGGFNDRFRDSRITLEDTTMVASTTVVAVRITEFRNGGPFDTSESSYVQRYTLRQEEGQWRFSQFPWPMLNCGPVKISAPTPAVVEPTPAPTPQPKQ